MPFPYPFARFCVVYSPDRCFHAKTEQLASRKRRERVSHMNATCHSPRPPPNARTPPQPPPRWRIFGDRRRGIGERKSVAQTQPNRVGGILSRNAGAELPTYWPPASVSGTNQPWARTRASVVTAARRRARARACANAPAAADTAFFLGFWERARARGSVPCMRPWTAVGLGPDMWLVGGHGGSPIWDSDVDMRCVCVGGGVSTASICLCVSDDQLGA